MDNGSVKKREMHAPSTSINKRATPWWPVLVFVGLTIISIWIFLLDIKEIIVGYLKKKKSVKGKVVLITGAGRGIGRGVALKLSELGACLACVDVNTKNNEETVRLIREQGGKAEAFTCNVANAEQINELKRQVNAKLGTVDILVNNAALLMGMTIKDMSYKDIRGMYEVNCMGPAFMTKAFLPDMMDRNSGHLVVMSSIASMTSVPYVSLYCSTKSAVSRFFECMRVEMDEIKNNNIKVTIIHPYFVNTSADYTSWFDTILPILEEDGVCRKVVDSILYERKTVSIPGALSFLKFTDALSGSHQYNVTMKFLGSGVNLPSKNERDALPYSSIVQDISNSR